MTPEPQNSQEDGNKEAYEKSSPRSRDWNGQLGQEVIIPDPGLASGSSSRKAPAKPQRSTIMKSKKRKIVDLLSSFA